MIRNDSSYNQDMKNLFKVIQKQELARETEDEIAKSFKTAHSKGNTHSHTRQILDREVDIVRNYKK